MQSSSRFVLLALPGEQGLQNVVIAEIAEVLHWTMVFLSLRTLRPILCLSFLCSDWKFVQY